MFDRKEWMKQWRKNNPEKVKKINNRFYQKHREKRLKESKEYQKNNPEKVKKSKQRYYYSNYEKVLKQVKQYYKNHFKESKEYQVQYRENHPEVRKQRYKRKLQYVQDYKLSKGCSICGYNKNPRFLVFHHPDDNKEYNVSVSVARDMGLKKIKKEMDKCILLCNNCHPKLHWKLKKLDKIEGKV